MAEKPTHQQLEEKIQALELSEARLKRTEKKLRESETLFRTLFETAVDAIFIKDKNLKYRMVNSAMGRHFGKNSEDLIGKTNTDLFGKKISDKVHHLDHRVLKGETVQEFANRLIEGQTRSLHIIKVPHKNSEGKITGLCGIVRDITELKQAEAVLRQSEEKYRTMIERSNDMIWTMDTAGNLTFFNEQTEISTGLRQSEWIGKSFVPLIMEEELPRITGIFQKCLKGESLRYEFRFKKQDGSILTFSVNTAPIFKNGDVNGIVSFGRDITEQQKLESQLLQTQKMQSIGTLAGGIAHDFNNILFPILGHAEMLLLDVTEDNPFRDSLNQIYTGAMRASELVKQILTFSRQEKGKLKLMKMQPIIKEALKLIRSTIPTTIAIKQDISPGCDVINADPTQIHQIVMNLCTNAYHAMEDAVGELKVSLNEVELGGLDQVNPDMATGVYACLTVADTGKGMDKNLTDKIFDPFFTTKEKGKGTGMGLSVVHGIVTSMNGAIQVYSEPGKGTVFNVYLPVEKSLSEEQVIDSKVEIQRGTEQILLVDDEDAIIAMEKLMLERLGYQVTSRTSSIKALEAFRDNPEKFDLVITDMAMPNMPGDKLSAKLTKIRPDIPVLLCTGFSEAMSEDKAASLGINGFLFKPIVMKDLSQKIREVLDKK